VGSVRVGVAQSDPHGVLATPVATLARDDSPAAVDQQAIAELVAELGATLVVVGLPRLLSGGEGAAATAARTFAGQLARRVAPVPVRLLDERFTTLDAAGRLRDAGTAAKDQRRMIDQAAAVLILQDALDAFSHQGRLPGDTIKARRPRTRKAREA